MIRRILKLIVITTVITFVCVKVCIFYILKKKGGGGKRGCLIHIINGLQSQRMMQKGLKKQRLEVVLFVEKPCL